MVHILRQRTDNNVLSYLVVKEPTAYELRGMKGFEHVGSLSLHIETGPYSSTKLQELLKSLYGETEDQIKNLKKRKEDLKGILDNLEKSSPGS